MKDFLFLHIAEFGALVFVCSLLVNIFLHFSWTKATIITIIDDTLKVNDGTKRRFSGTKLTMFVAFVSVLWSFHYITIKYGFNEYAFITMACIATGVSITGAYSKKINPPAETKEEPKQEPPVEGQAQ